MQVQVNSGNSVEISEELATLVVDEVKHALRHFESRLTRVEVHVNDLNSHKGGAQDKRCQIEARPNGLDPVSASHDAASEPEAVRGAAAKMERVLDTLFGKLSDRGTVRR
jgi:ribosome-associated translation inhibitor RaiA